MNPFLQAAIDEAQLGWEEGGIPIGSVIVHAGEILGRGHNRRVQRSSPILHGEMDALENAGRLGAEPGEEAMEWASAIERALAPEFSAPSIKSLAAEGTPSRWYQNLEEFQSAALESLDA